MYLHSFAFFWFNLRDPVQLYVHYLALDTYHINMSCFCLKNPFTNFCLCKTRILFYSWNYEVISWWCHHNKIDSRGANRIYYGKWNKESYSALQGWGKCILPIFVPGSFPPAPICPKILFAIPWHTIYIYTIEKHFCAL